MNANEMLQYVRDHYDAAREESDKLFGKFRDGKIDIDTWMLKDMRLAGMRETYAGMLGALGVIP